jgi:hypothetical protein
MAASQVSSFEFKNILDIITENKPTFSAAERIRKWIEDCNSSEINALSVGDRLRMIKELLNGWTVSEGDWAAIRKTCASVTTPAEANEIRKAADALHLSDDRRLHLSFFWHAIAITRDP